MFRLLLILCMTTALLGCSDDGPTGSAPPDLEVELVSHSLSAVNSAQTRIDPGDPHRIHRQGYEASADLGRLFIPVSITSSSTSPSEQSTVEGTLSASSTVGKPGGSFALECMSKWGYEGESSDRSTFSAIGSMSGGIEFTVSTDPVDYRLVLDTGDLSGPGMGRAQLHQRASLFRLGEGDSPDETLVEVVHRQSGELTVEEGSLKPGRYGLAGAHSLSFHGAGGARGSTALSSTLSLTLSRTAPLP